jgi:ATP-dependent protease ClpP protease subunit
MLISLFFAVISLASQSLSKTISLSSNNFVSLVGPVTSSAVDDVIKSLNTKSIHEYIQENKQINLYINSPGGSVFSGII